MRLGNFNFNPADWKNVSEDAKTLIRQGCPEEKIHQMLNKMWKDQNRQKQTRNRPETEVFQRVQVLVKDWKLFFLKNFFDVSGHLLKMNPKDRYTAEQALNHEWIKNKALHRFGREMFLSGRDDDPPVIQKCSKTGRHRNLQNIQFLCFPNVYCRFVDPRNA